MSVRRFNGQNVANPVPLTGSVGLSSFLGDYGVWGTSTGGSTNTVSAERFDNSDCIKVVTTGAGSGFFLVIGNINQYPASTINATALSRLFAGEVGKQLKISADVYIESAINMQVSASFSLYNDQLQRSVPSGATQVTTVGQWVSVSHTITLDRRLVHYRLSVGQVTGTPGSITCYFRNVKVERVLPDRTTISRPRLASRYMGGSTQFNGTTSTIPTTLTDNTAFTSGFVLHGWIKPRTFGESNVGAIMQKEESALAANGFYFSVDNGGGASRLRYKLATGGNVVSATGSIQLTKWQHVILHVSSNGTASFYVNGTLSGTPSASGALSEIITANPLTIGNRSNATDRTFDGSLAELGIISLAGRSDLTEGEINNLYTRSVLPAGATNFWKLDEQPSTYTDSIGSATGTGTSTAYSPDTPVQQRVAVRDMGTALSFDGVNDQVTTTLTIPSGGLYTFSGFAFRNNNSAEHAFVGTTNGSNGMRITLKSGNNDIRFQANIGSGVAGGTTFTNVGKLQDFFNWTVTYNLTTAHLYIDGKLVASKAYTEDFLTGQTFCIGKYGGGGTNFFPGIQDEIRYWNRVLSAEEIQNLYFNNIVPRDGLVGEWLFNEASGTTALDTSGNGNNGTISGASYVLSLFKKIRTVV